MKLNNDLIRDILLTVEDTTGYQKQLIIYRPYEGDNDFPFIKDYDTEELLYHIYQCSESGLIKLGTQTAEYIYITDLSPKGHSYIENIRNDNVWSKTKSVASKIGSKSLDSMIEISSKVITQLIIHELGV